MKFLPCLVGALALGVDADQGAGCDLSHIYTPGKDGGSLACDAVFTGDYSIPTPPGSGLGTINLGLFTNSQIDLSWGLLHGAKFKFNGEVVATQVSTVGIPSVFLGQFETANNFDFMMSGAGGFNWGCDNSKCNEEWANGTYSFQGSFQEVSEAVGLMFGEIIEFEGDKYDPSTSKIVQSYPLTAPNRTWNAMTMECTCQNKDFPWLPAGTCIDWLSFGGRKNCTFGVTSSDGVFGLKYHVSNEAFQLNANSMLTPNNTKIDVTIADFPFSSATSKLALKTYVMNAQQDAGVTLKDSGKFAFNASKTSLSWANTACSDTACAGDSINVDYTLGSLDANVDFPDYSMAKVFKYHHESANTAIVYFSFDRSAKPELIYWDPTLAYNFNADTGHNYLALILCLTVGGGLLAVAAAVYCVHRRRQKQRSAQGFDGSSASYTNIDRSATRA